jgi:hypothetical protein
MSASRTAGRLVRCYPRCWQARYGEELEALIVDMSGEGRVPWRVRADVAVGGGRERLRVAGLGDLGTPPARVRGGLVTVLWAWALFVLGAAIVQKTSEHWQQAMPAASRTPASVAFGGLTWVAVGAGVLVLAAIALAIPSLLVFVREGGWPQIRRRLLSAGLMTSIVLVATVALVVWAHSLTPSARDGHDTAYALAFVAWAVLVAGGLLAWTAAAAATARCVSLRAATLRTQARIAMAVSVAMGVMTAATVAWWIAVADVAPAALTGGPTSRSASALVPQLILAAVLMLLATALGAAGARRAAAALPELADGRAPG